MELPATSKTGSPNPFNNNVVIIDEAHNFVSRIVNKLKKPKSISMKLYNYIMAAENCKVIFLSGTPIINYPNEVGIMYNMLRGYIKTYYFNITTTKKLNNEKMINILSKYNALDYIEYKVLKKQLIITRNPFSFISKKSKKEYAGVAFNEKSKDDEDTFIKNYFILKKEEIYTDKKIL